MRNMKKLEEKMKKYEGNIEEMSQSLSREGELGIFLSHRVHIVNDISSYF